MVLRGVSLSVDAGRLVAVFGGRGQGKTTLIRVASGTLPAEEGDVFIDGQPMVGISDSGLSEVLALKVGLAGRAGPDAKLNVGSYVEMRLNATREYSWRLRGSEVRRTLREFDLAGTEKLMWSELSDWQRIAVELAQAVVVRPRLLLVDDILDGLARGPKNTALEMLEGFASDIGCGVLMAVSDHTTASRGGQVFQLTDGKLRLMHKDTDEVISLQDRRVRRAAAESWMLQVRSRQALRGRRRAGPRGGRCVAGHRAGEMVALYGPSGSGKSTLIDLIAGFQTPDAGTVVVDGRDIASFSEREHADYLRLTVGIIGQGDELMALRVGPR